MYTPIYVYIGIDKQLYEHAENTHNLLHNEKLSYVPPPLNYEIQWTHQTHT